MLDRTASATTIDAAQAFCLADRRCRTLPEPGARDVLLRSLLHLAAGRTDRSLADLDRAAAIDAADPLVMRTAMLRHPDRTARIEAAQAILDEDRSTSADVAAALEVLLDLQAGLVVRLARRPEGLCGWIVWQGTAEPIVEARSETAMFEVPLVEMSDPRGPPPAGRRAGFRLACDPQDPVEVTVHLSGCPARIVNSYALEAPAPARAPRPAGALGPQGLDVIVPIYEDPVATEACLAALVGQVAECPVRYWLVDDHSPDPRTASIAAHYAARLAANHIVNRINHGFAGAVNRALAASPGGDALLLNADVVLPPDALRRLIAAAYGAPDIGTVMPMSNDSEFTSFPVPYRANPVCGPDRAAAIDAAARTVNGTAVVDVANTIGFCLYVTQDCLARTGLLRQSYGRGYYEDVDLSLRAREAGFRSVAATGLYVSHGGGRSFLGQKRSWVARNRPLLERRFPAYSLRCATYVEADPLRAARSAIEEHLGLSGPIHLLVGRSAFDSVALAGRARQIVERGGCVLLLSWGAGVEVTLRAFAGFGPHALHFPIDHPGLDRLARYLARATIVAIEADDPQRVPDRLLRLLRASGAPLSVLVGSRAAGQALSEPSGTAFDTAMPLDAMAQGFLDRRQGRRNSRSGGRPSEARQPIDCIGIAVPEVDAVAEGLVLDLARRLTRQASPRLVLLGRCVDDRALMASGRIHVTGPIARDDYPAVLDDFEIDALFSPYRESGFGFVDDLARATHRPKAYFDWSGRRPTAGGRDLAMAHRLPEPAVAEALSAWCRPVLQA